MFLNIWDLFHLDTYSEISINLEVSYFVPPVFTTEFPSLLTIQICTQTQFDFPKIFDKDGDFSRVEILNQSDSIKLQNSSIIFRPMSTDQGLKSITIQLIDAIELVTNYTINISIVDNFKYKNYTLNKILVYYPRVVKVDISKLLVQSIDNTYNVQILERNIEIKWVKYNYENKTLVISNYTKNDYGTHNLSISIFDS